MASGAVTGLDLMERAGRGVVDAIYAHWPDTAKSAKYAVVLCGPGNNGGDGFVVARLLAKAGWTVEVHFYGNPEKLPADAALNYARWQADHPIWELSATTVRNMPRIGDVTLYIDALFGIGLSRPLEGEIGDLVAHLAGSGSDQRDYQPRMVAIDVPSGLDADSGRVVGAVAPYAALTVTFDSPKAGHFLADGPSHCGALMVCDIGIGGLRRLHPAPLRLIPALDGVAGDRPFGGQDTRRLSKHANSHKYDHGAALILSGGVGRGGAARLTARGALRIGAGLVTIGCPPAALIENAAQLTAIMLRKVADADALNAAITADNRINAIGIGPGLGTQPREAALVRVVLEARRACVLDADALTLVAQDVDLMALLHDKCVLTPHGGEFSRLFPDIAKALCVPKDSFHNREQGTEDKSKYVSRIQDERGPFYSKVDAVRDAATRAGCIVLLKGPDTVIAHPNGTAAICSAQYDRAAPWLATAGAGDVLAGFITGLLARGLDAFYAAETGAWLHQECALSFGSGLIAEDLPEELPKVFRKFGI